MNKFIRKLEDNSFIQGQLEEFKEMVKNLITNP